MPEKLKIQFFPLDQWPIDYAASLMQMVHELQVKPFRAGILRNGPQPDGEYAHIYYVEVAPDSRNIPGHRSLWVAGERNVCLAWHSGALAEHWQVTEIGRSYYPWFAEWFDKDAQIEEVRPV